jgi:hypothetical protein
MAAPPVTRAAPGFISLLFDLEAKRRAYVARQAGASLEGQLPVWFDHQDVVTPAHEIFGLVFRNVSKVSIVPSIMHSFCMQHQVIRCPSLAAIGNDATTGPRSGWFGDNSACPSLSPLEHHAPRTTLRCGQPRASPFGRLVSGRL